jgi:signal transduction histidine kinase
MTIRRKLTGVLLVIALLPVIGLMGVEYGIETGQLVEREGLAHADAAVGTLDKLDRLLFERYRNLLSWAGLEVMQDILVDDIDKRIAGTLRGLRMEYGVYSTLYCLDAAGNVVADGSEFPRTGNEAAAPWFISVMAGERWYQSAEFSPGETAPVVRFAAPIRSPIAAPGPIGVLVVEVDPDAIASVLDDLQERMISLGHVPRLRLMDRGTVGNLPPLEGGRAWRVETGQDGHQEVTGYAESGGFRDFQGFHWVLAVAEPMAATLAPLQRTRRVMLAVGVIAALVSLAVASLLSRGLARPLEVMTEAARAIERSGELSASLPVVAEDEIGALARTFNHMLHRLRLAQRQLVQHERLTAIGQVAAEVAHDLATPATTIANLSRRLLKGSAEGSRQHEQLQLVLDSAVYVQGLVSRLLAFARSEQPEPRPIHLAEVIGDALRRTRDGAQIELHVDGSLPDLLGDATAITRLLVNLLENAVEAAGPEGKVWIRARHDTVTGAAEIEVGDDGPGISEAVRNHLFEPFVTTKGQEGTGLGLAIGYRIARDHGGTLALVDGQAGQTTFRVRLPVREAPTPTG